MNDNNSPQTDEDFRPVTTLLEEAEKLLWQHGYYFPLVDMAKFIEGLPEMDAAELGKGEAFWEDVLLLIREINFLDNEDDEDDEQEFTELVPTAYIWECPTCGAENEIPGSLTTENVKCLQCRTKATPLYPKWPRS